MTIDVPASTDALSRAKRFRKVLRGKAVITVDISHRALLGERVRFDVRRGSTPSSR